MEVLVFLVPLALTLGAIGLMGFLWSLKNGQYDDLEGAGWRAIADDEPVDQNYSQPGRMPPKRADEGRPRLNCTTMNAWQASRNLRTLGAESMRMDVAGRTAAFSQSDFSSQVHAPNSAKNRPQPKLAILGGDPEVA